jgi:hypothetical protein
MLERNLDFCFRFSFFSCFCCTVLKTTHWQIWDECFAKIPFPWIILAPCWCKYIVIMYFLILQTCISQMCIETDFLVSYWLYDFRDNLNEMLQKGMTFANFNYWCGVCCRSLSFAMQRNACRYVDCFFWNRSE